MAKNVYQTNKGGEIKAPCKPSGGDPKATTIKTNGDLRSSRNGK